MDDAGLGDLLSKKIVEHLRNDAVGQPEDDPLVDCPTSKAMPEQPSFQHLNLRGRKSPFAARTETVFPDVFCDDLSASRSREDQVNNDVFGKFGGRFKHVILMSCASSLAPH